jgi:hypothetical protein
MLLFRMQQFAVTFESHLHGMFLQQHRIELEFLRTWLIAARHKERHITTHVIGTPTFGGRRQDALKSFRAVEQSLFTMLRSAGRHRSASDPVS